MDALEMPRDVARISGEVLRWARRRADIQPEQLASAIGKGYTASHVLSWESGESFPTFRQAEIIADKLHVPFGILFMENPPELSLPIPDLRTVSGEPPERLSLNFLEVINDCLVRQFWYADELTFQGVRSLPFVGRFNLADDINGIAADITSVLEINDDLRRRCSSWEEFLTELVDRSERVGVLIMRSSVVRHSTRRGLPVREFRGFAISNPLAPLVFINTKDARSAQIFTLAHELAHIWIGQSGISNSDPKRRIGDYASDIERFCNRIAAQVLVPDFNMASHWDAAETAEANIQRIASFHRVSRTVVAIRARDTGRISFDTASRIIDGETAAFMHRRIAASEREGGPSFWAIFGPRNSARFTRTLVDAVIQGRVFYKDAATLLGTKVSTLRRFLLRGEQGN